MDRTLVLIIVLLTGCGPIRVTVGLVDAERAVREARDAGAAEHAVYPFTLAEEFLAKAIEERGYAEWEESFLLANEAVERAHEATELCKTATAPPLWPAVDASPEPSPVHQAPTYYDDLPPEEQAPADDDLPPEEQAPADDDLPPEEQAPADDDLPPEEDDADPDDPESADPAQDAPPAASGEDEPAESEEEKPREQEKKPAETDPWGDGT